MSLRFVVRTAPLLLAGLASLWPVASATAQAAPAERAAVAATQQVPGYYRMRMGQVMVTAIFDGTIEMPSAVFKASSPEVIHQLLKRSHQSDVMQTAVNAFLVESGPHKVLIDVGGADTIGPEGGKITHNLKAAGIAPESVTAVLLTHLHLDHVAGLLARDGKAAFPHAKVYAHELDAQHWLSKDERAKAPEQARMLFDIAQRSLAPYVSAQRFHTFKSEKLPIEGLNAYPLIGHSPGHTGYKIESDGESMIFLGDVIHNHVLQMTDPSITMGFDWNREQAVKSRFDVLQVAADTGAWLAAAHTPFPGIGRVRRDREASYTWVPLEYTQALLPAAKRQAVK